MNCTLCNLLRVICASRMVIVSNGYIRIICALLSLSSPTDDYNIYEYVVRPQWTRKDQKISTTYCSCGSLTILSPTRSGFRQVNDPSSLAVLASEERLRSHYPPFWPQLQILFCFRTRFLVALGRWPRNWQSL